MLRKILVCIAFACAVSGAHAAALRVFMSPGGDDAADGASAATPVASLQRALAAGLAAAGPDTSAIAVEIGAGVYRGQRAGLAERPKGVAIAIRPAAGAKVTFDGAGKGGTWFTAKPTPGAGRLSIQGLEIFNYVSAISLVGSRDDPEQSVQDVVISGNTFRRIGQIAKPEGDPSTAAVRLVNTDNSRIVDNRFIDIRNIKHCGSLHGIYVAHGSTGNLIERNTFENACGDSIRFRDGSSGNTVRSNTFIDAWADAAVSDWYCDSSARADCTKQSGECPSVDNTLAGNRVVARRAKNRPELTKTFGADSSAACQTGNRSRFVVSQ